MTDPLFDSTATLLIEEHVRRLLTMMGFEAVAVQSSWWADESHQYLRIQIEAGEEGRQLIGVHGQHLAALQHVIRSIMRRSLSETVTITVDVNQYRTRRERSLTSLAEEVARKAIRTGRTVVLKPMPASDRRAIHTALAPRADVRTESLGDEPNRRVVVRPIFL